MKKNPSQWNNQFSLRVSYSLRREPMLRVILSACSESIIISLSVWTATAAESMILSAWHAESIILSALLLACAESEVEGNKKTSI
jgi:hypothetical protein